MLTNIFPIKELEAVLRKKRPLVIAKSVPHKLVQDAIDEEWSVDRASKTMTRMIKPKSHDVLLEDRVWCLLNRMGFNLLSGEGGARLAIDPDNRDGTKNQIDVVSIDGEIAVAVECKSAENRGKKQDFDKDIAKHTLIRERFINAVNKQFPQKVKRIAALAMFTNNIDISESDRVKAREANVILFNEKDLSYYENLAKHLGSAARYQFFSDLLPDRIIPGLEMTVPAIKGKMGGRTCYMFCINPDYLLKIAFVAHHAKGQDSDEGYQRMVAGSRLKEIRQYISDNGMFPTNIVINMELPKSNAIRFEQTTQVGDEGNGVMGWLKLKPSYGFAWIIDGQHRLYAYSGHNKALKSLVSVFAFEGLPSIEQNKLFVDINAKQKSVKKSHLQELYGNLRWDAVNPVRRVDAIISRSISALSSDADSPFFCRIQKTDDQKSTVRCLTVAALFGALSKSGLYISKQKEDGSIIAWGPLWAGDNAEQTVTRTVRVINAWFRVICNKAKEWWDLGSDIGGGLSMNDSIIACINVLRSVFLHLEEQGVYGVKLDDNELIDAIVPFAEVLGSHFGEFTEEQRLEWRNFRGVQGQTTRTRRCQEAIHKCIENFNPSGLQEYIETIQAKTNDQAKEIIDRMELTLQMIILKTLKQDLGDQESGWWMKGIPKSIRMKATQRREEDNGERGGQERYLDLIDYREIALSNWPCFQDVLGYGKLNQSKKHRTQWIVDMNEHRKIVMHASSGQYVSLEELNQLKGYDQWLSSKVNGQFAD